MIASAQTLRRLRPLEPFCERTKAEGMTYGLSPAGYDIRVAESLCLRRGDFQLASTVERFKMPGNLLGIVHDKSTWARQGLAVQNTVIEPGWEGFLTLELTHHGYRGYENRLDIPKGSPIAQVVFHFLDEPTDTPYRGKYQDQHSGPQPAIFEAN